jgi:23S rRNA (guanosine2251-2'-O)-methyltransferase
MQDNIRDNKSERGYESALVLENAENENRIEGRNAVLEAFRSGKTIDKLYVQDGCQDGPVKSITREARKHDTIINYVTKERLDQLSSTGRHQGVIAVSAAYAYAEVADILHRAEEKGEPPFVILLDGIEDPHNLGAIIRTANQAGAHGVIIPKRRAVGLTATVARASAGALNYTPVAKVTNLSNTIKELKEHGLWFVCADMEGTVMYDLDLTGPIGLVIGSEGEGVSSLVRKNCDMVASIPMKGDIDSLNASVATGVLSYEILRQRIQRG